MNLIYPEFRKFFLSDLESRRIFEERIAPHYFSHQVPSEEPLLILSGGQPGIGKTSARNEMMNRYGQLRQFVVVNADELREYHPRHAHLRALDDRTAYQKAHDDASRWMREVVSYARLNRFDLVIDSTMVSADATCRTAQEFQQAGYAVSAVAVAGHESRSRLQILGRYTGLRLAGMGRYVNRADHDRAYQGVIGSVARLEKEKLVGQMAVHRYSGGGQLYENNLVGGAWKDTPRAEQVMKEFRAKAMTAEELDDYFRLLGDLLNKRFPDGTPVLEKNMWAAEIADISSTVPGVKDSPRDVDAASLDQYIAMARQQAMAHVRKRTMDAQMKNSVPSEKKASMSEERDRSRDKSLRQRTKRRKDRKRRQERQRKRS